MRRRNRCASICCAAGFSWATTSGAMRSGRISWRGCGGFFMCDDFWGDAQWANFMESMRRVFPDRPVVDIPDDDPIFHVVYDLTDRYQVPGARYVQTGVTEKGDGCPARWRGIYDDRGRLVVAMTFQSDLGDSWEWADDPGYDEKFSALGIRIGINYIIYSMTH